MVTTCMMESLHSTMALLPTLSFFLLTTLATYGSAQSAVIPPSITGGVPVSFSTMTTQTSSQTRPQLSMTTSFRSSMSPNSTTSSTTSRVTPDPGPPALFPPAGGIANQPDAEGRRTENVFNYYFLILAVFGVLVALCLWWIRRQRKRKKEQMRLSGQNALARDLDGWVNTRRWMHGAWRHNQAAGLVRREEGLNEHGEAPPPYQPKTEVTVGHDSTGATQDSTSGLTIPLRTLSRDDIDTIRPPEYQELNRQGPSNARPETATTRTTRPDTADVHPSSSTRDLLRDERPRPNG